MNTNVFNQYYFVFLRKLRDKAKENKSTDTTSRNLIKALKNHYLNYDKYSDEYIKYYTEQFKTIPELNCTTLEEFNKYMELEEVQNISIYKDITVKNIEKIVGNKTFSNGYFLILRIFGKGELSDEEVPKVVEFLKTKDSDIDISSEYIKSLLLLFKTTQEDIVGDFQSSFKELENTSLGSLAKEIMADINIDELQNSLGNSEDIFKALANPEGGLAKLLGTVSQKMISKIATGELTQEKLLKEAISFSSKLQNQSGGQANMFGNLGDMMSKMQDLASSSEGDEGGNFDMSQLQNMMQSMAGNMAGGKSKPAPTANQAYDRVVKAKQLRRKLENRAKKSSAKVEVTDA